MGKYKSLGANSIYTFLGTIGSKVIQLIMLPFYTSWLSVEDFGTTDVINVYASLLMCIVTLSMHEAIFVFPARQTFEKQKEFFSTSFFSSILSLIFVVFISGVIKVVASYFSWTNSFVNNIWLVFMLFSGIYFHSFFQQFCRGINKMWVFCFSGLIVTAFTAILAFALIPLYGVYGYILSLVISYFIGIIFTIFAVRLHLYFSLSSIKWASWIEMAKYATPLIPNATLWWIISALNRPFMESALGLGAIGLFAVASKFPNIVTSILQIFSSSWQVSVLQEYGKQGFSSFFNNICKLYIPLLIIASSSLALSCKFLFGLFVDDNYAEGWLYSPVIALAVIAMGASGFYGSVFSAAKQSKYYLFSSIGGALTTILLNFMLIPLFGIWGACVSFSVSHFVICVLRIIYSRKYVRISFPFSLIMMLIMNIAIVLFMINDMWFISWVLFICLLLSYIIINRNILHNGYSLLNNKVNSIKRYYL